MPASLSRQLSSDCASKNSELFRVNYNANKPFIDRAQGVETLRGKYEGETVVVCGAGPSLDQALPKLCNWKGPIIACDRAARPLLDAWKLPDYLVTVDKEAIMSSVLDGLYPKLRSVPLAFDPVCGPDLVRRYPGPLYTWDRVDGETPKGEIRRGTSVIVYAVGLAELMGASKIVLTGVDLSFPSPERTHSAGVIPMDGDDIDRGVVYLQAANGDQVPSNYFFAAAVEELSQVPPGLLVQTSPAGAYIPGAAHASLEAVL